MKRKRILIALALLLALGAAYSLYEWLRPMTPGEVVVAYMQSCIGLEPEEHFKAAQYLNEAARERFTEYARLEREFLYPQGEAMATQNLPGYILYGKAWVPEIEIESETAAGDTAEVTAAVHRMRKTSRCNKNIVCPACFRLIRVNGRWLISHLLIEEYFEPLWYKDGDEWKQMETKREWIDVGTLLQRELLEIKHRIRGDKQSSAAYEGKYGQASSMSPVEVARAFIIVRDTRDASRRYEAAMYVIESAQSLFCQYLDQLGPTYGQGTQYQLELPVELEKTVGDSAVVWLEYGLETIGFQLVKVDGDWLISHISWENELRDVMWWAKKAIERLKEQGAVPEPDGQ